MEEFIGGCELAVRCNVGREADGSFVYTVDRVLKAPGKGVGAPAEGEVLMTLAEEEIPGIPITSEVSIPPPPPDFAVVCVEASPWRWVPGRSGNPSRITVYHGVKSVSQSMRFTYELAE